MTLPRSFNHLLLLSSLSLLLLSPSAVISSPELGPGIDLSSPTSLDPESLFLGHEHGLDYELEESEYLQVPKESDGPAWQGLKMQKRALGKAWTGTTKLVAAGVSGVGGMQISVVGNDQLIFFDKDENNPLTTSNGEPAWSALYTISTQSLRALSIETNSFCAGGGWLSNGTLVSVGGNPREGSNGAPAGDGRQAIRMFTPCTNNKCTVYENPSRIRLTSQRWYASTVRVSDGSILIAGGMVAGGYNNAPSTDNPTMEFFPPKGNGLQFYSAFLHDALDTNLFPIMYLLPNGYIFVAANELAMLYNWETNKETRLKNFPNGVRISYPASSASALLPLTVANDWTPEMLLCGGTTANTETNPDKLSAKTPASAQCVRMVLTTAGIKAGWAVESMPTPRVMGDAVLTPDGKVFIVNGAKDGVAGYGNVLNEVGASNSATPDYIPTLYDPLAAKGSRFTSNFPASKIERLYHSSATLLPDGRIFVTGSNPNDNVSKKTYMTRYDIEMFEPPYVFEARPTYSGLGANILYGKSYSISINIPSSYKTIQVVIMDLGYSTHGVHMNHRLVELRCTRTATKGLTFTGPQNANVYPPGYAWLYVLADGVPSKGFRVMIGTGASPPSSASASANLLKKTTG